MEKFDGYWGGWRDNQIDSMVNKSFHEPATAVQLLKRGELHLAQNIPVSMLPGIKRHPDIEVITDPSMINQFYFIHTQKPPMDDINVRRAIHHAINIPELVSTFYPDVAIPAKGAVPHNVWGHDANLRPYPYDLDKAKALLKKSKYAQQLAEGPMTIEIGSPGPQYHEATLYIQAALQKIGFKSKIDQTRIPMAFSLYRNKEKCPQMNAGLWWPNYVTPFDFLGVFHTERRPLFNFSWYYNSEFDKVIDEAFLLEGVDMEKAIEGYKKAQQILMDDAVALWVADLKNVTVKRKEIKGFKARAAYPLSVYIYDMYR